MSTVANGYTNRKVRIVANVPARNVGVARKSEFQDDRTLLHQEHQQQLQQPQQRQEEIQLALSVAESEISLGTEFDRAFDMEIGTVATEKSWDEMRQLLFIPSSMTNGDDMSASENGVSSSSSHSIRRTGSTIRSGSRARLSNNAEGSLLLVTAESDLDQIYEEYSEDGEEQSTIKPCAYGNNGRMGPSGLYGTPLSSLMENPSEQENDNEDMLSNPYKSNSSKPSLNAPRGCLRPPKPPSTSLPPLTNKSKWNNNHLNMRKKFISAESPNQRHCPSPRISVVPLPMDPKEVEDGRAVEISVDRYGPHVGVGKGKNRSRPYMVQHDDDDDDDDDDDEGYRPVGYRLVTEVEYNISNSSSSKDEEDASQQSDDEQRLLGSDGEEENDVRNGNLNEQKPCSSYLEKEKQRNGMENVVEQNVRLRNKDEASVVISQIKQTVELEANNGCESFDSDSPHHLRLISEIVLTKSKEYHAATDNSLTDLSSSDETSVAAPTVDDAQADIVPSTTESEEVEDSVSPSKDLVGVPCSEQLDNHNDETSNLIRPIPHDEIMRTIESVIAMHYGQNGGDDDNNSNNYIGGKFRDELKDWINLESGQETVFVDCRVHEMIVSKVPGVQAIGISLLLNRTARPF